MLLADKEDLQRKMEDERRRQREKLAAKMARHGCLDALLWGHNHMLRWDKETPNQAARHGHLEVLEWAHKAGCPTHMSAAAHEAVVGGHMNVLQWIGFWHNQVFRNHLMTQTACEYGHLLRHRAGIRDVFTYAGQLPVLIQPTD